MIKDEFTIAYLRAIEKKHKEYFDSKEIGIMDCVVISGTKLITVHVVKQDLPNDICHEIETMFWVD